jgi:hypothetical protein
MEMKFAGRWRLTPSALAEMSEKRAWEWPMSFVSTDSILLHQTAVAVTMDFGIEWA